MYLGSLKFVVRSAVGQVGCGNVVEVSNFLHYYFFQLSTESLSLGM